MQATTQLKLFAMLSYNHLYRYRSVWGCLRQSKQLIRHQSTINNMAHIEGVLGPVWAVYIQV